MLLQQNTLVFTRVQKLFLPRLHTINMLVISFFHVYAQIRVLVANLTNKNEDLLSFNEKICWQQALNNIFQMINIT